MKSCSKITIQGEHKIMELLKKDFINKDYILLLVGQFISKLGSGINSIGITLYVLRFDNPILGLGTLTLLLTIPWIIISPIAGTMADKYSKKFIIVICDILRGILSIGLFYTFNIYLFYLIVFLLTILDVVFSPAISGFLPFIVVKEDLEKANSLYSGTGELANLIGPALGGGLVALLGVEGVFLINGISYIVSGISEIFIKNKGIDSEDRKEIKTEGKLFIDIRDAMDYIKENKNIGFIIGFFAIASMAFGGLPILYLNFIKNNLMVSEEIYGLFMTLSGVGLLLGSFILPKLPKKWSSMDLMVRGVGVYGLLFLLFIGYKFIPYNMLIFFIIGIITSFVNVSYGIFLQSEVEKSIIGRVFSLDMTISSITTLISILFITIVGDKLSDTILIIFFSLLMIAISLIGSIWMNTHIKKGEYNGNYRY